MARIEEFEAKDVKLTPSDKGYAAVEMAARRIGPMFNQMAAGQRELGNLTKGSDEAIGRTTEAFLRFEGLSQQSSGGGVKIKGGGGRTLLGTGAGGDTSWNARANASNELRDDGGRTKGTTTGTAAEKAAAAKLQAEQLTDQLKAQRDTEDSQRKIDREAQDASRAEELDNWNLTHKDDANAAQMKVTFNLEADRVKAARLQEDAAIKATRDRQDAAIKEGRAADVIAKLDYKTRGELSNGGPALSGFAKDWTAANSAVGARQDVTKVVSVLRGTVSGAVGAGPAAQRAALAPASTTTVSGEAAGFEPLTRTVPETAAEPQGPDVFGTGAGDLAGQAYPNPTFLGNAPAVAGAPEQAAQPGEGPPPTTGGEEQYMPPTRDQSQIYAPIDQQSAPSLYSDMTGGM